MAKQVQVQVEAPVAEPQVEGPTAADLIKKFGSKSAAIRGLSADGKTRSEIGKMLGIRYQHVRNVLITPIKGKATVQ